MKIHVIDTGYFKLDGGAMFGVVPFSIWNKINPPDENNMCTWAMRCLLVDYGKRKVLIDTGIGTKQDEKFFGHYYLHGDATLVGSLSNIGLTPEDITDVFLTHLHFDHCGGALKRNEAKEIVPVFSNAVYWSNKKHWEWATNPNPREKASFLSENILPLQEKGLIRFLEENNSPFENIEILHVDGHTESQMLPLITIDGKKILFCADLIPSSGHLPLPYIMAYDVRPLETMKEKQAILDRVAKENIYLFFEHDPVREVCSVEKTPKGVRVKEFFKLSDIVQN